MGWQTRLIEAAEDMEITQEEVTGLAEGMMGNAIRGMVIVGVMGMIVREFYGVLGPKKYAKQEAEILKIVEEIW